MVLGLCAGGWRLSCRSRAWRRTTIDGVAVYKSANTGPAVFGLLRPRIVVPGWLARLPARQRRLAIAHERAHLDGRDPWLLAAAFGLLCAMPWNPALWWMLRRLRGAIEIDCDARVLRSGCDLAEYGETLVAVGQHQSGHSWAMAAMVPSTSFLERRIQIMLSNHSSRGRTVAAVEPESTDSAPPPHARRQDDAHRLDHERKLDAERAALREQAVKLEAEALELGARAAERAAAELAQRAQAAGRAAGDAGGTGPHTPL